jgi:hypothetical protein
MHIRLNRPAAPRVLRGLAGAVAASVMLVGCKGILDVKNPNNVGSDALDNPASAGPIVIGAENSVVRGLMSIYTPYAASTDETIWVGSRDAYGELDTGNFADPNNEYVDASAFNLNEGRWMADQSVTKLEGFVAAGKLLDTDLLVRAYINGADVYTTIGDMFSDFTISDRTVASPPVGEANMSVMYDTAITYLTRALPLATGELRSQTLGMLARAYFSKAVWQKVHPPGPALPTPLLVNDANASLYATQAIAEMSGDYRFIITTTDQNAGDNSGGGFGFEMNSRVELTPGPDIATLNAAKRPATYVVKDPVTGLSDAGAIANLKRVLEAEDLNNPPLVQTSKREMYLILAEAGLAKGTAAGDAEFDTNINALRALDSKVPYAGTPSRVALLQYERRFNLVFQGRRLYDMFRFGTRDPVWLPASNAVRLAGCAFSIPITERQSNEHLLSGYDPTCKT